MNLPSRLLLVPVIAAVVLHAAAPSARADGPGTLDGVAVLVNDEPILVSDVQEFREMEYFKFRQMNPGVPEDDLRRAIGDGSGRATDELIRLALIEQDARKYGLSVNEYETDDAIERLLKGRGIARDQLLAEIRAQGLNWERYRREVRYAILFDRLKMSLIRPRVSVTEAEVKGYYETNVRREVEEARVQMLFLAYPPQADKDMKQAVQKKAEEIRNRAMAGVDFSELVKAHSSGPNASRGGDLGVIRKGSILPYLEKAIFATERGWYSEIVSDERGIYILKVLDRTGGDTRPLEEMFSGIKTALENQKTEEAFAHYIEELVAGARIQKNI